MNIRLLAPQELQLYDSFVESFEGSLVYYARPFHAFLAEAAGGSCHYLAAFDGDEIQGVLPYFVKEHPEYGKVLNSLPWYGSYGGALYRSS
ncbi:MAG TPA: hypothetical protein PLL10_04195, partial [Elusimicrobiales bacterium]|nr:hypothetical protein [Elusimicrobiales bacterium]